MQRVPMSAVRVLDGFWRDRMDANRSVGIPRLYERLDAHGVVDNFRDGRARRGLWFTDSDLYKWMEAAAWSLADVPDPALEATLESVVEVVVAAQHDDGYLNTNFRDGEHFGDLSWTHELYCAGHLIQAAIAHRRVSGRSTMIDAAIRFADLLVATFGEDGRDDRDRHPVVEMALVELARETGDARYRALATACCDRVPHEDWERLWGHTVCALYFACGCADLALDGDDARRPALQRWWDDLIACSSYVTGGVGGRWVGESLGRPYELPNEGAYAESCAAVAAAQWAWRMLQLTGDAAVGDHLELVLHNALLGAVSLAGDEWFYSNPLASSAVRERQPFIGDDLPVQVAGPFPLVRRPWRDVTCCPPNVARLLASLPSYAYLARDRELRVVLYVPSRVRACGFDVEITTGMPWDGTTMLRVHEAPAAESSIVLRIPAWSRAADAGTWRTMRRRWRAGDTITFDLGVGTDVIACDPRVAENRGALAVRRGPIVYCAEGVDHPGVDVRDLAIEPGAQFDVHHEPTVLGGVTMLRGLARADTWRGPLYGPAVGARGAGRAVRLTLVPYFAWANRGVGAMTVWLQDAGFGRQSS